MSLNDRLQCCSVKWQMRVKWYTFSWSVWSTARASKSTTGCLCSIGTIIAAGRALLSSCPGCSLFECSAASSPFPACSKSKSLCLGGKTIGSTCLITWNRTRSEQKLKLSYTLKFLLRTICKNIVIFMLLCRTLKIILIAWFVKWLTELLPNFPKK